MLGARKTFSRVTNDRSPIISQLEMRKLKNWESFIIKMYVFFECKCLSKELLGYAARYKTNVNNVTTLAKLIITKVTF